MASVYARTGFRGGLNWYRNIDRNWELSGPWANTAIRVPAYYLAGSQDSVITAKTGKAAFEQIATNVPTLTENIVIQGAGHFVQEERSQEVNESLKRFLHDIAPV